jgi:hypothetical protein
VNAIAPDPDLPDLFWSMSEDRAEDPIWRDYALQQLAQTFDTAIEPQLIEQRLRNVALVSTDPRAGTASIQLVLLAGKGRIVLGAGITDNLRKLAIDAAAEPQQRMTALAILGETEPALALPMAREILSKSSPIVLKCAAIGVLGRSTEAADLERIRALTEDVEPLIRKVAQQVVVPSSGHVEDSTAAPRTH